MVPSRHQTCARGWSDCLRLEVADFGIKVVIIEHGVIETGFGDAASESIVKRSATGTVWSVGKGVALSIQKRTRSMAPAATTQTIAEGGPGRGECLKSTPRYAVGESAKLLYLGCVSGWVTVFSISYPQPDALRSCSAHFRLALEGMTLPASR